MSNENDLQMKMEKFFLNTCGTWQNCTESNIQTFLGQCEENNIDPQYCMSWIEQHQAQIPDWQDVSKVSLEWVNQHTSTGSPISIKALHPY